MATLPTRKFPAFLSPLTLSISTAAAGLSDVADLGGGSVCAIEMSTDWTEAVVTFLCGRSSGALYNLYGSTGDEVTLTTTGSRIVTVDPVLFTGLRFWQLRSGTSAAAVAQTSARTIILHLIG